MSSKLANNFLEQLLLKKIDFSADVFKIILLAPGFVFNRATHTQYSDVSASELPTALGYTVAGATLSGVVVAQDDVNNVGRVTWNSVSWTATGGNLVSSGAIIYDNTTATKYICGYLDFNGAQTTLDTGVATISAPSIAIAG